MRILQTRTHFQSIRLHQIQRAQDAVQTAEHAQVRLRPVERRVVQGALEDAHHVLFMNPTDVLPTRPDGTAQETFRDGFEETQGASPTA